MSNAKILLVDDKPANLLAMKVVLEPLGQPMTTAQSGHEALKLIERNDYAVILLDVQMPGFDGFETVLRMREHNRSFHTPIIFLTAASTDEASLVRGYTEGAVDYLIKPFIPVVLRSKVRVFVDLQRRMEDCKCAKTELHVLNTQLEKRVAERTAELEQARADAVMVSRAKSVFLASMSHELRTPLTSIIGFTDLIDEELTRTGQTHLAEDLKRVRVSSEHLLTLVNDVLDLSKIEASRLQINPSEFDIMELVKETAAVVQPMFERNGNTLAVECRGEHLLMLSDRTRVRQILINLLGNAAKFTEQGEVRLLCRRETGGDEEWVVVSVSDTGQGISESEISAIFEDYYQTQANVASTIPGSSGLGLSISRRLVALLQGEMLVDSTLGEGSTFTFRLPLKVATSASAITDEYVRVSAPAG